MTKTETQKKTVRAYLLEHGSITSQEAWRLDNITRLSGIIFRLRKDGMNIITDNEGTHGRYRLVNNDTLL